MLARKRVVENARTLVFQTNTGGLRAFLFLQHGGRLSVIEIPLTQGQVAIIDDEDAWRLSGYHWCAQRVHLRQKWYAVGWTGGGQKRRRCVIMHRLLTDCPPDKEVHHSNRDSLDNRRHNLMIVSRREHVEIEPRHTGPRTEEQRKRVSCALQGKKVGNISPYRGVSWHKKSQAWQAAITVRPQCYWLGTFATHEEAAAAYDRKAIELFGDTARVNFPEVSDAGCAGICAS